jgi:hypothetical protein
VRLNDVIRRDKDLARLLWLFSRRFFDYAENAASIDELDERIKSCRQLLCDTTRLPVPSSHDTEVHVGCFTISITRRDSEHDDEGIVLGIVVNELAVRDFVSFVFAFFFLFSFRGFCFTVGWME